MVNRAEQMDNALFNGEGERLGARDYQGRGDFCIFRDEMDEKNLC